MRLGGIKQKKSAWGSAVNNTNCLLFYSPKTRSHILTFVSGFTNYPFADVYFSNSKMASSSWVIIRIHVTTPWPYKNLGLLQTPYFSCAEPNWISSTLERRWRDIWFRRRTVCRTYVKFDKFKVRQTLSNLTLFRTKLKLPYQIDSDTPYLIHQLGSAHDWSGVWTGPWTVMVFTPRRSNFR